MKYFRDKTEFESNMIRVKDILEEKGYLMESDHEYAYSMQYPAAYDEVVSWLEENGYRGEVECVGAYDGVAVYGLYDKTKVSYEDAMLYLKKEAKNQI